MLRKFLNIKNFSLFDVAWHLCFSMVREQSPCFYFEGNMRKWLCQCDHVCNLTPLSLWLRKGRASKHPAILFGSSPVLSPDSVQKHCGSAILFSVCVDVRSYFTRAAVLRLICVVIHVTRPVYRYIIYDSSATQLPSRQYSSFQFTVGRIALSLSES